MKQALVFVMCFFAGLPCAFAQSSNRSWTLAECIAYAGSHNLQVQTFQLAEMLAEQDLKLANSARIPSLSAGIGNIFDHANNPVGGERLVSQVTYNTSYALTSSLILWNDNYLNNNIRQRQLQLQSAGLQVQQSRNTISLQVTQYFLNVLLARETLKYVEDLVKTSEAVVKRAGLLYDAGSIAKKDLLQLQAQLASDRYLLVQTQNSIRQSVLLLKQLLQLPGAIGFDIVAPDTVIVERTLAPLADVQQSATSSFPDVKIGRLAVDVATLDMAKASAGFKPVVSANATLATGYSSVLANPVQPKGAYLTQTGDNFYQRLGLTLTVPIYANYTNKAARAKAAISYRQALLNWKNDQLVLMQAVEQAYLSVTNALQSYDAASEQLKAATETFRIANEQFRLGAINSYDLLQQRNQYVQAVQAFTQAKFNAVLQQKIYEFYMGKAISL